MNQTKREIAEAVQRDAELTRVGEALAADMGTTLAELMAELGTTTEEEEGQ